MLLTRREIFSFPLVLVPKSDEARLAEVERKMSVLHEAMVGTLEAMQALSDRQELIINIADHNAMVTRERLTALEAEIFPSLEQGDESYG